jgi:hypothetical protein
MPEKHEPPPAPVSIDAINTWVWQRERRLELAPKSFTVLRALRVRRRWSCGWG